MAWFIEQLVARQQLIDSTDRAIEKDIIHTLNQIGFPEEQADWKEAAPTRDPHKDTLHVLGHPVMSGWERPYMRALAEIATAKGGRVLELGFGLGLSASYIQEHHPDEHVIIEMNHAIAETDRHALAAKADRFRARRRAGCDGTAGKRKGQRAKQK